MFTRDANLSDLLEENEPLRVSNTIHKAFIEVNEEGAESGAATSNVLFCFNLLITIRLFTRQIS